MLTAGSATMFSAKKTWFPCCWQIYGTSLQMPCGLSKHYGLPWQVISKIENVEGLKCSLLMLLPDLQTMPADMDTERGCGLPLDPLDNTTESCFSVCVNWRFCENLWSMTEGLVLLLLCFACRTLPTFHARNFEEFRPQSRQTVSTPCVGLGLLKWMNIHRINGMIVSKQRWKG